MSDIAQNLPMAMMIAAFTGISWYIGVEINISLFLLFKRRSGLYFWSCALSSWAVILQPLFIILADFGVWRDAVPSITMIYLTWLIMVIPQSWVLYSRLYLLLRSVKTLSFIKYGLIFNSIVFSVPTIVIGTIAQTTTVNPKLTSINLIWDRVQLVVFFVQETTLSVLYIFHTWKFLRHRSPLKKRFWSKESLSYNGDRMYVEEQRSVLWQLIYVNTLIVALDITLLGIQCANLFQLQGAFKPCVYGIKLKAEYVILNRLVDLVQQPTHRGIYYWSGPESAVPSDNPGLQAMAGHRWHNGTGLGSTEDTNAIQLVESYGRHFPRPRSAESQVPFHQRGVK
ncbi:unnamed protein product [Penicillium salamii]|uniref:DUF7703 domain-containing protein n=1 Tax=Penicillium salamii TaxID=1612424 RepID=A0A9W4IA41_9EURO|nr:unnamed protein product [Penicillium salamii]